MSSRGYLGWAADGWRGYLRADVPIAPDRMLAVAAGGVIFVGALASDGAVGSAAEPAPTPDLSCARQPGPADTIITLDGAVPQPILFAMRGTPGICMGTTWPGSVNIAIVGLRANTDLLAHVNLAERNTCPATLYGFADQETAAVRLIYDDGSVLPLTLVAGPAALQTEGRFFYSVNRLRKDGRPRRGSRRSGKYHCVAGFVGCAAGLQHQAVASAAGG
jgi:hypothetical protein